MTKLLIDTLVTGQLDTNCYLITDPQSLETLIIDPGDDADYIIQEFNTRGYTPVTILATHGHFDHLLAALELQLAFNLPLLLHPQDQFLVRNIAASARHFTGISGSPPPKITGYLDPAKPYLFHQHQFSLLHTPGHTPGSISLYNSSANCLFSGDTLFAHGAVGRTDFSYGDTPALTQSVRRLLRLPATTHLYPGHGDASTIGQERSYHPSLSD